MHFGVRDRAPAGGEQSETGVFSLSSSPSSSSWSPLTSSKGPFCCWGPELDAVIQVGSHENRTEEKNVLLARVSLVFWVANA